MARKWKENWVLFLILFPDQHWAHHLWVQMIHQKSHSSSRDVISCPPYSILFTSIWPHISRFNYSISHNSQFSTFHSHVQLINFLLQPWLFHFILLKLMANWWFAMLRCAYRLTGHSVVSSYAHTTAKFDHCQLHGSFCFVISFLL